MLLIQFLYFFFWIIRTVSGAPSGAVDPVTNVCLQKLLQVHPPGLLILFTYV